jgi:hypothetical protein
MNSSYSHSDQEVYMYPGQSDKLERYLRNSERFLWGVITGNKETVLTTLRENLKELGEDGISIPESQKSTYAMITVSLLAKLGIEKVITEIVATQVRQQFANRQGALDFLRAHWLSGTLPRWQTLQTLRATRTVKQKLLEVVHPSEPEPISKQTGDILDAFVEVNNQYKYVHGWTVFAGLWFEEIEPLLKAGV